MVNITPSAPNYGKEDQTEKIEVQKYLGGKCPDDKKKKKSDELLALHPRGPGCRRSVYERVKTQTDATTLHVDLWMSDRLI